MPEKLVRCFLSVKKDLRADNKSWSSKRVDKVARAICVKKTGQTFDHSDAMAESMFDVTFSESGVIKKLEFRFSTPYEVVEKADLEKFRPNFQLNDPDSQIVVGRANYDNTSTNFNRYEEKEAKKATKTMPGIPCQVDHSESARDTFGLVQDAWWDTGVTPPETTYLAELEGSDPVTAKVVKKYVRGVSVAGDAGKIECSICGESWSFMHEHWPGETYEGEVCERVLKDITYRHLGFTPFPAIQGADAQPVNASDTLDYMPSSLMEAIDNAMAFADLERKGYLKKLKDNEQQITEILPSPPVYAFGEYTMTDPDPKAIQVELQKMEYKLGEKDRKLEELNSKLEAQKANEEEFKKLQEAVKSRLVEDVIGLEIRLKKVEASEVASRKEKLRLLSNEVLDAKLEVLKEFDNEQAQTQAPEAGSRSKLTFGEGKPQLDEAMQNHYMRESKMQQLHVGLFGRLPSISSVRIVRQWDRTRGRWNTDLTEMFRRVPKTR